ncbi:MAG: hypothetical protein HQ522_16295 [Bacteroidetes bacterium]|nr:hypothetical protein [Bacteroidota bacterium]
MGTFKTTTGEKITKAAIDRKVRAAKQEKINQMIETYGYVFCEDCNRNDCTPVDCSHDKSVDWCQKNGCVELAWDVDNITMLGRKHHQKKDGLDLRFDKL